MIQKCVSRKVVAVFLMSFGLGVPRAWAVEVLVQNDSLVPGAVGSIQAGFDPGESAAAWLTSPCNGNIVAVQVFWRSVIGGAGQSLEESIIIHDAGTFPTPGPALTTILGPVMTDGVFNEFRFLDDQMTIPISVPVTANEVFVVSFTFLNDPNPVLGPSVVNDTGCQAGKNSLFAGVWFNSCALGVSGDWAIRAVVDCEPNEACCIPPSNCLNLTPSNCLLIPDGAAQGPGTTCATTECFPMGACCQADGTCTDNQSPEDCDALGGTFQGDDSLCSGVSCPLPTGACCLSNGACIPLTDADCDVIPNSFWAGALTDCSDDNMNGTADDCEAECTTAGDCDDFDACTGDSCQNGHCINDPLIRPFGDIFPEGGDGLIDVDDLFCSLDAFADLAVCPSADIAPCGGNGIMDVDDLLAELDAFAGMPMCPDPC